MSFPIVVILLIVVIAGFFFFRRNKEEHPLSSRAAPKKHMTTLEKRKQLNTATLNKIRNSKEYWAVIIKPENPASCCKAMSKLADEKFHLDHIPALPLTGCDKPVCLCLYVGLKDRRKGIRRLTPDRREEIRFDECSDRRSGRDRRKSGQDIWSHHDLDL